MKLFKLLNTSFGWLAFFIAAVTYLLTLEPTMSFWDCGAFITSAYNLELTHPPGAPLYTLTGRLFSLFASDSSMVAWWVNAMSALLSAFTILFLFWTITHLARKIIIPNEESYTTANIIAVLGAGMVGALAFTWSITFWFSAVEAEVYGFASFFTAIVFWLILKWEEKADEPGSDSWLILIAYMMGLSIGVHLLNLLTIPALVLVYYFRKYQPSVKGLIGALAISVLILAFVLYGFISGVVEIAAWFELFFVNTLGFSFNSGLVAFVIVLTAVLAWAIYETYTAKNKYRIAISFILGIGLLGIPFLDANIWLGILIMLAMIGFFVWKKFNVPSRWLYTTMVMVTVMFIGFSTYATLVIRSSANPPLDQSSPDNIFSLRSYLAREQYGDSPLLRGATFNAPPAYRTEGNRCIPIVREGRAIWAQAPRLTPECRDRYIIVGHRMTQVMDERFMMWFPRMHNAPGLTDRHIEAYKQWSGGRNGFRGRTIHFEICGHRQSEIKPTFVENMRFFFSYQLGFMYWRYFMWNFSGRQNDIQGQGEIEHGNWITGFPFIDNLLVGRQDTLPTEMLENRGRNRYYMLPLLLGILGMLFLINSGKKGKQQFWIVLTLFVLTGIAIVVYLNQTPLQVRERDYAFAGSFYAFAIWIGLGVLALYRVAEKHIPKVLAAAGVSVICLGVPILMASENWDDSDRSGRYTARDFGHNYLVSVGQNAILFTNGDNDTFPLWYNQKVEGVRPDVRVTNLSYLQTDWYILQMQRGALESPPLPISWRHDQFISGTNDFVRVRELVDEPLSVCQVFNFVLNQDPRTFDSDGIAFIPTRNIFIPIDADQVIATGTMPESRRDEIVPRMNFELGSHLNKSQLMVIEMINQNRWERPMYFAFTVGPTMYLGLDRNDHLELTGLTYQIVPVRSESGVNTERMYYNMMNRFRFGNANNPRVYMDETTRRMALTHRMLFSVLADALLQEGDSVRALNVLNRSLEVLPGKTLRYEHFATFHALHLYELGEYETGDRIMNSFANNAVEHINWYLSLRPQQRRNSINALAHRFNELHRALVIFQTYGRADLFEKYLPVFEEFERRLN